MAETTTTIKVHIITVLLFISSGALLKENPISISIEIGRSHKDHPRNEEIVVTW